MYIYMGMFFNSQQDVPDFGSIAMYFVGTKDLGYVEEGHKRFRKYTFQSTDLSKLSLITNAIDGSEAFAVDTGTTYVLYDGQWSIKSSDLTPSKMAEMLGNITQIDYQVVNQLPQTGIKGTIYLVAHETAQGDYYDEYIWTTKIDELTNENVNIYEKIGNTAPTISTMVGATYSTDGSSGLVPAPLSHNIDSVLFGDGQWKSLQYYPYKKLSSTINCNNFTYAGLYFISYTSFLQNGPENFSLISNEGAYLEIRNFSSYRSERGIQNLIGLHQKYERSFSYEYSTNSYSFTPWIQSFTIQSSVPSNAVFTDTTYTLTQDVNDGHKMTFTPSNGNATIITIPDNNTTYEDATQSVHGLMSSADKTKLDGITISDYLRKDNIVTLTAAEYEALVTKTAPYYFITDV